MLYDRPYMKATPTRTEVNTLKWLLISLLAVYVIQSIAAVWFQSLAFNRFFELSAHTLMQGQVWTLLSYGALHDIGNPFHLIFNGLVIFFFGRPLQRELGGQRMLEIFLLGVGLGALLWLPFNWGGASLVGASAGALTLLTVWCLRHMEENVTLLLWFVIPVNIKPKFLLWVVMGLELFLFLFREVVGTAQGVAHSAHLGGIFAGFLFVAVLSKRNQRTPPRTNKVNIERPRWRKVVPDKTEPREDRGFKINISSRRDLRLEVDRILDKINSKGFGSLSTEEKETLDKAKEILRK